MRTIVLGGTRFIGRAVVAELVQAGHDVLIVHRGEHEPEGLPPVPHLHAHRRDLAGCADELCRFRPDGVVDMCAMTRSDADIALAALPEGPRLLAVSSINVYRACSSVWAGTVTDAVPLTEASSVRDGPLPDRDDLMEGYDYDPSEYENLDVEAAYLARGATVCRLPVVYGPHDFKHREDFVLRRIRAQRRQLPVGAGGFLCSRGYAPELARGIRLALEHPAAAGEVFNLCEAQCAPLRLWIEQIITFARGELALVRVPDRALPEDLAITGGIAQPWLTSPAKAQAVLGWVHRNPTDCVRESVRWHIEHPPSHSDAGFDADDRALATTS
ncbi:MAG: NAD-dependent epimerase/dehydratase family protein [Chloroflexi bacterium]|nr:NAD-dependent epimerase/dehydratase family protein [Chloroflexota bacterium]